MCGIAGIVEHRGARVVAQDREAQALPGEHALGGADEADLVAHEGVRRHRLGAIVRAAVDDAEMARGVGIDTSRVSMYIFALGALLAALGGVIGGAFLGVYPGLDFEILPVAFAVVIIGGMGSLAGAAIGSLLVGLADNFGKALFPEIAYFTLYAPMVLILALKPTGLFGRE